jgi:gamma-glutamyltranspeptidase/glutathione hydrolase
MESGFPYQTIRDLIQMGHKIGFEVGEYGGYQGILFDSQNQVYFGASESRKDGMAAGY